MRHTLFLAVLISLAGSQPSIAQDAQRQTSTTRLIPFSGSLTDASGTSVSGLVPVTFSLFDEPEGGSLLWSETQQVIVDERRRYTAYLGRSTALPLQIFRTEQARWLEVSIDGRAQRRAMLVAVPYALRAADAETLGGKALSEFVLIEANGRRVRADGTTIDGVSVDGTGVPNQITKWSDADTLSSSVVSESFDNRIGIFAPDPTGGGVVDSRFTIRHLDNNTAIGVLNTANQRRFALNIQPDGSWRMFDGVSGTWNMGLRQLGGAVGIGFDPVAKLEVVQTGSTEAGVFSLLNSGSSQEALVGLTIGTGPGVHGQSTNLAGMAARFVVINAASNLIVGQQGGTNVFRVNGAGAVFASAYNTGGADFAEAIDAVAGVDAYEPGDVMVIAEGGDRSVDRAAEPYARTVIGIYSTKPGILASPYPVDDPRRAGKLPLAMIGIVPCKVSAENGPVERGDLLVTSGTPGHAMKGTDRTRMTGAIVGKALEPLASGTGTILVAVTLQ